jgi:hypothetical protein
VESVTLTVKVDVPEVVGVPDTTPVEAFKVKPAGNVPTLRDHEYGPVPPEAARVVL